MERLVFPAPKTSTGAENFGIFIKIVTRAKAPGGDLETGCAATARLKYVSQGLVPCGLKVRMSFSHDSELKEQNYAQQLQRVEPTQMYRRTRAAVRSPQTEAIRRKY
jgi:hypothetical protein